MFRRENFFYTTQSEIEKALVTNNPNTPLTKATAEPITAGQYFFNPATKELSINDDATKNAALYQKLFGQMGDTIEVNLDIFAVSGTKPKVVIYYMNADGTIIRAAVYQTDTELNKWKNFKVKHYITSDAPYFRVAIGTFPADIGVYKERSIGIEVQSKTSASATSKKSTKKFFITKPAGTTAFSFRSSDFANDVGTLTQIDNFTLKITFDPTDIFDKRPVVIVSESGYGDSTKYRAKPFDVYRDNMTIKLFDVNNVAVNLTTISSDYNIMISVIAVE